MVSPDRSVSSRTTAYLLMEEETKLYRTTIASPGPRAAVDAAIASAASNAMAA